MCVFRGLFWFALCRIYRNYITHVLVFFMRIHIYHSGNDDMVFFVVFPVCVFWLKSATTRNMCVRVFLTRRWTIVKLFYLNRSNSMFSWVFDTYLTLHSEKLYVCPNSRVSSKGILMRTSVVCISVFIIIFRLCVGYTDYRQHNIRTRYAFLLDVDIFADDWGGRFICIYVMLLLLGACGSRTRSCMCLYG